MPGLFVAQKWRTVHLIFVIWHNHPFSVIVPNGGAVPMSPECDQPITDLYSNHVTQIDQLEPPAIVLN